MKQILVTVAVLFLSSLVLQCDEKKPPEIDFEDPGRFFPVNLEYTWTYAFLGQGCLASEMDTYVVTAQTKTTRLVEGVSRNGWDLEVIAGGEGTGFMYQVDDTVFYWRDVQSTLPPYKILVGPVKGGTFWKGRDLYGYEYLIVAIEDFYSATINHTFRGCAKVKRTAPDQSTVKYYWWAPAWGKVREADFQGEQCVGGEDLKRLEKNPEYP
jgi:hypothetical protein